MKLNLWKLSTLGFAGAFVTMAGVHGIATAEAAKQPHMVAAAERLIDAKRQLSEAAHNKEGHRVKAIAFVEQAMNEVKLGIEAGEEQTAPEPSAPPNTAPTAAPAPAPTTGSPSAPPDGPHTSRIANPK